MQTSRSRSRNKATYFATVPTQEIVPVTNDRHESSVSGIFVIGDATGTPLVKVAAQHGREVVQYLAKSDAASDPADRPLDVVIIGAGPGGISAAVEAKRQGFRYVLLERGQLASTIADFPLGKMVYSEPRGVSDSSAIGFDVDEDRDTFMDRLDRLVTEEGLVVKKDTSVERIERRQDGAFEVVTSESKRFPTRQVIIAIGRQGEPRPLECVGADKEGRVVYQLRSPTDYVNRDVLVVGGGNSAIESTLMLMQHNRVTLSYRGTEFYRAKKENRRQLEAAIQDGGLRAVMSSQVTEIGDHDVQLTVGDSSETLRNDVVIAKLGTLPPIDFYLNSDLELDGIWNKKRVFYALIGLLVGVFIYFGAKHLALHPDAAGQGRWLIPGADHLASVIPLKTMSAICQWFLPLILLPMLAIDLIAAGMRSKGKHPILEIPHGRKILWTGALAYLASHLLPSVVTLDPGQAGPGPYYVPGFAWMYHLLPTYFGNAYGLYYLAYFSAIAGFGIYWAAKSGHAMIWRRNLTIIVTQWTLWWGIPTFIAVFLGRNPWTPLISKSLNAWPLNLAAFQVAPAVGPSDPAWWHTVAVAGVVWAVFLTFVVIPLMTIRWGKIYCSYICSCGALAETVGNGYRHRGPKGDTPRRYERYGFVFVALAAIVTIADLYGFTGPLSQYNLWVGTALAGAVAIGVYPFLGQRLWCRMWCPLAFWMNFWGRWSRFKITPEPGKCIDCNVCNQYCQMGIDIKSRALKGLPITLTDSPCVGCNECIVRCPMDVLHLGDLNTSTKSLPVIAAEATEQDDRCVA
ncbi:NAD(P)-binding domain-containing protein [Stieleria varia]|uniref:Ferredoxin--NADP reductase n=1 Tax=Stieleria varia TaxID=2528005 RepID=A0A5C6B495_9BACT|nr:NAD(P)-binding domain-containing protein [Stieleria varia]TWU06139.1 Ferredoxin--NADP reductase [Stieleria varia]